MCGYCHKSHRTSLVGDLDLFGGERIAVLCDRIVGVLILWPEIQDLPNWRSLFAFSKFCKERQDKVLND